MLSDYVKLCRPHQYLKNAFVLVGLMFGGDGSASEILRSGVAFVAFCSISSAVYIANEFSTPRPTAAIRPNASARSPAERSLRARAWPAGRRFSPRSPSYSSLEVSAFAALLILGYALINFGYSMFWKHVVIVDVFLISSGFMLRLLTGTLGARHRAFGLAAALRLHADAVPRLRQAPRPEMLIVEAPGATAASCRREKCSTTTARR